MAPTATTRLALRRRTPAMIAAPLTVVPSGSMLAPAPTRGTVIAGKYRVEQVLGQGGMGVVVAAKHMLLEQRVALKFVLDTTDPEATDRFMREARATARLENEHVCRVMDVGTTEAGAPYIVMEMLSGMDLAEHLLAYGPLPFESAVDYVLQALEALAEAHARGIVHRDLKPSNLFLATRGDGSTIVKVLDFGISKLQELHEPVTESTSHGLGPLAEIEDATGLTKTGMMMGSPPFMSPEQLRCSKSVDARCDVWAIGAILYELLSGQRAFPHGNDMYLRILSGQFVALQDLRPDLPPGLSAIVAGCLRVSIGERFPSAAALATALAPFAPAHARPSVDRAQRWDGGSSPVDIAIAETRPAVLAPPSAGSAASVNGVAVVPQHPSTASASRARTWLAPLAVAAAAGLVFVGAFRAQQHPASGLVASAPPTADPIPVIVPGPGPQAAVILGSVSSEPNPSAAPLPITAGGTDAGAHTPDAGGRHAPRVRPPARTKPASTERVDLGRL